MGGSCAGSGLVCAQASMWWGSRSGASSRGACAAAGNSCFARGAASNGSLPFLGGHEQVHPGGGHRPAVDRIVIKSSHSLGGGRSEDPSPRRALPGRRHLTAPVESAEPLAEAVDGRYLGDHGVKAVVGTDLDALSCHHECQLACTRHPSWINGSLDRPRRSVSIQRSHATRQQVRLMPRLPERSMHFTGGANSIDDDAHSPLVTLKLADDLQYRRRDPLMELAPVDLPQAGHLGSVDAPDKFRTGQVVLVQAEALVAGLGWSSGHLDDLVAARQASDLRLRFFDLAQSLDEGPFQVGLIQDHETVVACQACVNRPHLRPDSVGAEQQS